MRTVDPIGAQEQACRRLAAVAFAYLLSLAAAKPFLAHWPKADVPRRTPSASLSVLRWLDAAAAGTSMATAPLVAALASAAADLNWRQSYAAADFGPAFLDGYGWTELVGPTGPIPCDEMTCGFLLLGPDLHYPSHAHEAEELYVPLSGTALWQQGEDAPAPVAPGTPIHHPSWLPHAMRTQAEPLVALYCWRGGALGAKPQITGRA